MADYKGFPRESIDFLSNLRENNSKIWFEEHRSDYEHYFLEPAREFVGEMGAALRGITPRIKAIPLVNKSLFKIHRDVRFSKDKTPFKTHMAIWFWEGERKRMECSGFYFHLEPGLLMLGAGIYMLPKDLLEPYRKAVSNKKRADSLAGIFRDLTTKGNYTTGDKRLKKIPRGYGTEKNHHDLLLYTGITAALEGPVTDLLFSGDIIGYCLEAYRDMLPLHNWMVENLG